MDTQNRRWFAANVWDRSLGSFFVATCLFACGSPEPASDGLPGRRIILTDERPGENDQMVPLACDEIFTSGGDTWMNADLVLEPRIHRDLRVVVLLPGASVRGAGARLVWTQEERDPEGNLTGVLVEDAPGVYVEGVEVSGFDVGVHVMRSDSVVLAGVHAAGNRQGMRVDHLSGARIESCAMEFNYDGNGLDVSGLRNSAVENCWIADNKHDGLYLLSDSRGNRVESTWIVGNGDEGLGVGYSGGNMLRANTIQGNGHGILLYNAEEDTVRANRLRWNVDPLVLETGVFGCVVEDNAIVENRAGISIDTAVGCRFVSNRIEANGGPGMAIGLHAHGNELSGNVFDGNAFGVLIHDGAINPKRYRATLDAAEIASAPRRNVIAGNRYRSCETWIRERVSDHESDIRNNEGFPCDDSFLATTEAVGASFVRRDRLASPRLLNAPEDPVLEFSLPSVEAWGRVLLIEGSPGVEMVGNRVRWRRGPAEDPRIVLALVQGNELVAFRTLWLGTLNQDF